MQKKFDYMMWQGSSSSAKLALAHYEKKYGKPPEILIVSPDDKPAEGMNVVVKVEKFVPKGMMYIGNVKVSEE
jgi:hypothetical protein